MTPPAAGKRRLIADVDTAEFDGLSLASADGGGTRTGLLRALIRFMLADETLARNVKDSYREERLREQRARLAARRAG